MSSNTIQPELMPKSLTKNPDRFSEDAWDLLLASEDEARKWRHEYLDVEHILHVLFTGNKFKKQDFSGIDYE